jgi:hypothetical protein
MQIKPNPYENFDKRVLYHRIKKAESTYPEDHPEKKKFKEARLDLIKRYPELKEEK